MTNGKTKFDSYATSHPINEGTSYVPRNLIKSEGNPGGKLKPYDSKITHLQDMSLMKSTCFGAILYDIHLDMKLDYTISGIFQDMSLSRNTSPIMRIRKKNKFFNHSHS